MLVDGQSDCTYNGLHDPLVHILYRELLTVLFHKDSFSACRSCSFDQCLSWYSKCFKTVYFFFVRKLNLLMGWGVY